MWTTEYGLCAVLRLCLWCAVLSVNSIICVEYYLSAVLCLCSIVCVERGVIVRMRATWRTERPPDSFPSQPPDSVMPLRWDGSSVLLCEIELVLCVFSLEGPPKPTERPFCAIGLFEVDCYERYSWEHISESVVRERIWLLKQRPLIAWRQ